MINNFIKPEDIDLQKRKSIIREELSKLLGTPQKEKLIELRRLKQKKFDRQKSRLKIRKESQRRNRGR